MGVNALVVPSHDGYDPPGLFSYFASPGVMTPSACAGEFGGIPTAEVPVLSLTAYSMVSPAVATGSN